MRNPLGRYLMNSPVLPDLNRDPDGGLTLYIQSESPGKDKESNWVARPGTVAGSMWLIGLPAATARAPLRLFAETLLSAFRT